MTVRAVVALVGAPRDATPRMSAPPRLCRPLCGRRGRDEDGLHRHQHRDPVLKRQKVSHALVDIQGNFGRVDTDAPLHFAGAHDAAVNCPGSH